MDKRTNSDPDREVGYPLRWPVWLRDQVDAAVTKEAAEAKAKLQPAPTMASWLRQAALEKLARDAEEAGQ